MSLPLNQLRISLGMLTVKRCRLHRTSTKANIKLGAS